MRIFRNFNFSSGLENKVKKFHLHHIPFIQIFYFLKVYNFLIMNPAYFLLNVFLATLYSCFYCMFYFYFQINNLITLLTLI